MRRLIAGLTSTLVIGAIATVILTPGTSSLASTPSLNVVMNPPAGQQAVSDSTAETSTVTFGGQVTPGSMKIAAVVHYERADGSEFRVPQHIEASVNFNPDGTISGTRTLNLTPNNPPNSANGHGGSVYLVVTARDPGDDQDQEITVQSNAVPVDIVGPSITKTQLTAPDTLHVVFSEPVFLKSQQDSVVDWSVDGVPPIGIVPGDNPKEKILTLAPPAKDEDATPDVVYKAGLGLVAGRERYADSSASNPYVGNSFFTAQDLIPPRAPVVSQVAGTAGNSAVRGDPTPEIVIPSCGGCGSGAQGIRPGHHAELYLESNGQPGFQRPGDAYIGEDLADGSGAQITAPDLGPDGTYKLYVIARDNAVCNPDDSSSALCPNRSGVNAGSTVSYVLDRVGPALLFAAVTGPGEITVAFTEPVTGANDVTNWTVSGGLPVTFVDGSGDRRTLTAPGVAPSASLTYTPGNYVDAAGNPLPSFSTALFDNLPPVVTITDPANDQFVSTATYTLGGTSTDADVVEIFRDNGGNGTPDGPSIASTAPSGGSWSVSVPLNANVTNNFVAQGVRTTPQATIRGPNEVVPPLIQDSIDPTLTLDPLPDSAFRGQELVTISWSASDANFDEPPGPIKIEYSEDGGTTWSSLAENYTNVPPTGATRAAFDWTTPLVNTMSAKIRVTATDRAGRSVSKESSAFEIDSLAPVFSAALLSATQIGVSFSEPVSGLLSSAEWRINDQMAGQIQPTGPVTGQTNATLTTGPGSQIDPSEQNSVSYGPLSVATDLEDHVGNPILLGNVDSGGPGGGGGGDGAQFTVQVSNPNLCTIIGTDGADTITGTEGQDIICPSNGNDHIQALGGNDIILTGLGNKTIDGGDGNDEINGGPENDTLIGGGGSDLLVGDGGIDSLLGGEGDDIVLAGDGDDSIDGGTDMDVLSGEDGSDDITGGADIDHISGGGDDDTISGGDGEDRLTGDAGDDALRGGDGDDALDGGDGNDTLAGETGDDELLGGEGKDQLLGDNGNDRITGGEGNDRLSGDQGNDRLEGGNGDDRIDGGEGNDNLSGSEGKDTMLGQDGNDKLLGSDDNDTMYGGEGRDQLSGESGRDRLLGGNHRDKLLGGSGRDRLDGGDGGDFCDGGTAPDSKISCEGGPST